MGINRINDIMRSGLICTAEEFQRRFGVHLPTKVIDKLKLYIPQFYQDTIVPIDKVNRNPGLVIINDRGVMTYLGDMSTKDMYKALRCKRTIVPTARKKWVELLEDFEEVQRIGSWKRWYLLPYELTREGRLQSFQYRIINRTLPCNEYLYRLKVKDSPRCTFCNEIDDIMHFLFECNETNEFWDSVGHWLQHNSEDTTIPDELSETDFLFGFNNTGNDTEMFRINYIMLLGKFYVYRQKTFANGELDPYTFLVELKNNLCIERMACTWEGTMEKKFKVWSEFYEGL